ncbi:MAG: hemolysin family protein [Planctomycetaceae bacterium]
MSMWGIELGVMATMVAINSVFAAYEIALASISIARLKVLQSENRHGSRVAVFMKENMEASLAVVQLGITLVGAIAAATGGAGAEETIAPIYEAKFGISSGAADLLAIASVVLPLTVVSIVFGELVPKVFALRNKEWVVLTLSPPMRLFSRGVWPAVWTLESTVHLIMRLEKLFHSNIDVESLPEETHIQELRTSASLARSSRIIGAREESIIHSASQLSSRPVREIILPAEHISMLNIEDSLNECLVAAHLDMHTRFPVTEKRGDPQAILGYVNFKDIVAQLRLSPHEPSLRAILRPIPTFSDSALISSCLERMMREHTHIALVRDVTSRVVGMITLEDIIEELVGEIEDEHDRLPTHAAESKAGWVVGGGIGLPRLKEVSGIDLAADMPNGRVRNLSHWVEGHLGRPVRGGDILERGNYRILVRKLRRQEVLEAQISPIHPQ